MTSRIPDPAEIVEVDGVGPNLDTPQHDGVQQWSDLYLAQPFGRPRGRERGGGAVAMGRPAHQGCGRRARGFSYRGKVMIAPPPWGPFYRVGRGEPYPSPSHLGWRPRGGARAAAARARVGRPPPPKTLTLAG
jgi:hypothetical protein